MNRTFEFAIHNHISSIPGLIIDLVKSTLEKCCDLLDVIEITDYQQILLIGKDVYYAAGLSVASQLEPSSKIPVKVLSEKDACEIVLNPEHHFENTLSFSLFPNTSDREPMLILSSLKEKGSRVICITDTHPLDLRDYDFDVMWITIPAKRSELHVRHYSMATLTFLSLSFLLSKQHSLDSSTLFEPFKSEVIDASFQLTRKMNDLNSDLHSLAQKIQINAPIVFIGEGNDYAPAFLANHFLSKYALRNSQIIKTSDILQDITILNKKAAIIFSSSTEAHHDVLMKAINSSSLSGHTLCIVTDDSDITSTSNYNVIHTTFSTRISSSLFSVVVPSLLVGHLFE